ncbi:MAG: hypothetical protein BWY77_00546 [bacterium ADurb.Bin431]|nr:MAG: hypothetical protein BWY77_00546 [bacterium ADurb.Bin431]HOH06485.1 DUF4292 domain-containing protein [bacterium]
MVHNRVFHSILTRGASALLLAVIMASGGCATFRRPALLPADTASPQRVLTALESNYARIDHFNGRGRLQLSSPSRSLSLDIDVLIDQPDTLFLRLEALLGLDVGWLFSDRHEYRFYLPTENLYGQGAMDSLRWERFFRIAPGYDLLLGTLVGLERGGALAEPVLGQEEKHLVLTGTTSMGLHTLWIDPGRGVVTRSELCDSTGRLLVRQRFERFSRIKGVQVPHTIRIERPAEKQHLILQYDQISINKKYSAQEIKTKIPASAHRIKW